MDRSSISPGEIREASRGLCDLASLPTQPLLNVTARIRVCEMQTPAAARAPVGALPAFDRNRLCVLLIALGGGLRRGDFGKIIGRPSLPPLGFRAEG